MRGNVPGHGRHSGKTAGNAGHAVSVARRRPPCRGPRTPAPGLPAAPGRLPRRPAFGAVAEPRLLPGAPGLLPPAGCSLPVGRRPWRSGARARSRGTHPPLRGRRGRHIGQGRGAGSGHVRGLRRPEIRSARGRRDGRRRRPRRLERRTDGRRPGGGNARGRRSRRGWRARTPAGVSAGLRARSSAGPVRLDLGNDIEGGLPRLLLRAARRNDGGDDVARRRVAPGARETIVPGREVADRGGVLRRIRPGEGRGGRSRLGGLGRRFPGALRRGALCSGGVVGSGRSAHGEGPGCPGCGGGKAEQESGGKNGEMSCGPEDTRGAVHAASIAGASPGVHEKPPGKNLAVWNASASGPPGPSRRASGFRDRAAGAGGQKDAWASPQSLLVFTEQGGNYVQ